MHSRILRSELVAAFPVIFALMLFSVVVGLPEGLMGFAGKFLGRLFRIPDPPRPAATALDDVLPPRRAGDGGALLELRDLKRHFGGVKAPLSTREGRNETSVGWTRPRCP